MKTSNGVTPRTTAQARSQGTICRDRAAFKLLWPKKISKRAAQSDVQGFLIAFDVLIAGRDWQPINDDVEFELAALARFDGLKKSPKCWFTYLWPCGWELPLKQIEMLWCSLTGGRLEYLGQDDDRFLNRSRKTERTRTLYRLPQ